MNSYSEETLIEEPAIALLAEMGWETLDCRGEFGQAGGSPHGIAKAPSFLLDNSSPAR